MDCKAVPEPYRRTKRNETRVGLIGPPPLLQSLFLSTKDGNRRNPCKKFVLADPTHMRLTRIMCLAGFPLSKPGGAGFACRRRGCAAVRVDHGGRGVFVTEEFLHGANIGAGL